MKSFYLLSKKVAWGFLTGFFVFDSVVSYWAVVYKGGHEANLIIAPLVEKFPLLYFLCIPAEIIICFGIVWVLAKAASVLLKSRELKKDIIKRITLTSLVIYWAVANSSMNLAFLLGFRLPMESWVVTSFIGLAMALVYAAIAVGRHSEKI